MKMKIRKREREREYACTNERGKEKRCDVLYGEMKKREREIKRTEGMVRSKGGAGNENRKEIVLRIVPREKER